MLTLEVDVVSARYEDCGFVLCLWGGGEGGVLKGGGMEKNGGRGKRKRNQNIRHRDLSLLGREEKSI